MPQLHPPSCTSPQQCIPPTSTQLGILILGLYWLVVGTGGIGPCTILFAINQFDTTSPAGRKGVNNFFNWYYTSQTMVQLISLTAIVYLQNKNWISGMFLPCFDLFLQPALAKVTKKEEGLTSLQKIVIGDVCSILTMVSASLVE
ncbi:putative protein NRT1/ PTR FAMILY 2.14 [Glycine max]|nr:putative protein NRT1/ PTR FAMILY 2.14 [Glycine max]